MSIRRGSDTASRRSSVAVRLWAHTLAREPLVHFALAAGLVFGLYALVAPPRKPVIRVDKATVEALLRERAAIAQRPLVEADRQDVIETYIRDEILLREARKRGLDQAPRLRAQLVQLMGHALAPESTPPGEAELRAFYAANRTRYERPAALTLAVATDAGGGGQLSTIRRASAANLGALYGREAASAIVAIDDAGWHGPFASARGPQYLRVLERHEPEQSDYEQVAAFVAQDFEVTRQAEAVARAVERLARDYTIERPR